MRSRRRQLREAVTDVMLLATVLNAAVGIPRELLIFLTAFLLGTCIVSTLFLLPLIWVGHIRERNIERTEKLAEEAKADAWAGISEARRRHPSPEASTDLEALEVEGPVYIHTPERVGSIRRAS